MKRIILLLGFLILPLSIHSKSNYFYEKFNSSPDGAYSIYIDERDGKNILTTYVKTKNSQILCRKVDLKNNQIEASLVIDIKSENSTIEIKDKLINSKNKSCYNDLKMIVEASQPVNFTVADKNNNNYLEIDFQKQKYFFSYYIPFLGITKIQKKKGEFKILLFGVATDYDELKYILNINFIPVIRKISGSIKIPDSKVESFENQFGKVSLPEKWFKTGSEILDQYYLSFYSKRDAYLGFTPTKFSSERNESFFDNQKFILNNLIKAIDPNSLKFKRFSDNRILFTYQSADILTLNGMTQVVMAEISDNDEWRSVSISSYFGFYELNQEYFEKILNSVIFKDQ